MSIETYQTIPEMHGEGTFFYRLLYIRGSDESNKYWNEKLNKRERETKD